MQRETVAARESSSYTSMSSLIKEAQRPAEKSFTGILMTATNCRVVLHARTADVRALGTPSSRATWSSNTTAAHVAGLLKVTSSLPHKRSPSQPLLHGANSCMKRPLCQVTVAAMSPTEHPSTQVKTDKIMTQFHSNADVCVKTVDYEF